MGWQAEAPAPRWRLPTERQELINWPGVFNGAGALRLPVFPEHRAQPVGNFTHGRVRFRAAQDMRHQVIARPGSLFERPQPLLQRRAVARCPHFTDSRDLLVLQFGIQPEGRRRCALRLLETVHAHYHNFTIFHGLLEGISGVLDLILDIVLLYRRQRSAQGIDSFDILAGLAFNFIGEFFYGVTATHRIRRMGDAAFVRDDLLGP